MAGCFRGIHDCNGIYGIERASLPLQRFANKHIRQNGEVTLKILFYQWNAYNLYDIRVTLETFGHEITMLTEPVTNPEEDSDYTEALCQRLQKEHYDFLFSINFFPVLAEACHSSNTLYVCWNCDSPLLAMYHESIFYSTNVVFTFDYSNYQEFHTLGVNNIYHLPLAVHTERLAKQIHWNALPKYPVSFVGSLYEKNSYDRIADKLPSYLCGYLEGAMNAQLLVSGGNLLEPLLTEEICLMLEDMMDYQRSDKSFADVRTLFCSTVLGFKTASLERQQNLNTLSLAVPVHLFTGSPTDNLPLVISHKPVDYLTEMPQIFHDSKVNLNMTIPNIKTGIPLRVWDILGSGGFVLSNYQTEFEGIFEAGGTLDIYEDKQELLDKTDFYLKHDTLRNSIARRGLELVTKEHNYKVRIRKMLEIIKPFVA